MGSGTGSQAGMSRPAFGKVIFVQRPSETPIYTVPSLAKTQTSSPSQLSASLPQQFCSLWCVSLPSPQVVISWASRRRSAAADRETWNNQFGLGVCSDLLMSVIQEDSGRCSSPNELHLCSLSISVVSTVSYQHEVTIGRRGAVAYVSVSSTAFPSPA